MEGQNQLDSFIRFDRTPTCDRQTDADRQADTGPWPVPALAWRRAGKNDSGDFSVELIRHLYGLPGRYVERLHTDLIELNGIHRASAASRFSGSVRRALKMSRSNLHLA